jgi:hypothetical protein
MKKKTQMSSLIWMMLRKKLMILEILKVKTILDKMRLNLKIKMKKMMMKRILKQLL